MAQYEGTVKWFNNAKGFGFLGRNDGNDVFVTTARFRVKGIRGLRKGTR